MAWNNLTLKMLDVLSINLYGTQIDFRVLFALSENIVTKTPIFYRTEDDDLPYIRAIPTRPKINGGYTWDDWTSYAVNGKSFEMVCPSSSANDNIEEYVFALVDTNVDMGYRVYKVDGKNTTMGQATGIADINLAPILLGRDNDGNVRYVISNYFNRYDTNTVNVPYTEYDDNGNVSSNGTRDVTIQELFGSSSNFIYEGCAPRFETNCKVFDTVEHATAYLETGATDGLLEEEEEEPDTPEEFESDVYFYEVYNEYYSDLALTNHILTTNQKYTITFEDFPKGTTPIHAQLINNKYMNNVQFIVANGYGQYITSASSRIGNIEVPITTDILSTFMAIRTNYGILEDTVNDRYCKTVVFTNMPIIGVDGSALPGRIPNSDDMISAENGANYDCGLSECWLLDTENVSKLASIFNTTIDRSSPGATELVLAEWVQGLSCYSNPLDVVCDLFYMPINVSDYITGSSKSFTLQPSING